MANAKRQRKKEGHRARLEAARAAARREQRKKRAIAIVIATAAVIGVLALISAVGGDDDPEETASETSTTTATTEPGPTTTIDPNLTKPEVGIPDGPPPTELRIDDVKVGDGAEAKLGDSITVHYVGVTFADGTEFDSSWENGSPATFDLVQGGLIDGWTEGIPGMKVGGRRRLVIPSEQAYGDNPGGGRPAGALVFVVDLVAVNSP